MDKLLDTENNTLELLCHQSVNQYGELVTLLQSLKTDLQDQSASNVTQFNLTFAELQQRIEQTDLEITQQLQSEPDFSHIPALWNSRQELQREVLGLIEETVPRAGSIKSLLANEMQALKQGKKALSGYKSQQDQYGRIVNKTF